VKDCVSGGLFGNTNSRAGFTLRKRNNPAHASAQRKKSGRQDSNLRPSKHSCGFAGDDSQIDSQNFAGEPDLQEIAAAWGVLPPALKAAILAIVRSHGVDASKRSAQPVPPKPEGLRGDVSPSPKALARSASHSRERGSEISTRGNSAAGRKTKAKTARKK
jgi:hypothetical protein